MPRLYYPQPSYPPPNATSVVVSRTFQAPIATHFEDFERVSENRAEILESRFYAAAAQIQLFHKSILTHYDASEFAQRVLVGSQGQRVSVGSDV